MPTPEAAAAVGSGALQGFCLAHFSCSVQPVLLRQLVQLLAAAAAPDELLERLQAAAELLSSGRLQLSQQQQEEFGLHHAVLQQWVARGRADKVAGAVGLLLGVLGV